MVRRESTLLSVLEPYYLTADMYEFAHYRADDLSVSYYGQNLLSDGQPGVELYIDTDLARACHYAQLADNQFVVCQIICRLQAEGRWSLKKTY